MAPFSHCLPLLITSCHLRPKPNLLPSTTVANSPFPYALCLKKWVIPKSNKPRSPLTTSLPKDWPWKPWLQKHQHLWINASIGSSAATPNVSFSIYGVTTPTIALIMPANIIPWNITKQSVRFTSRTLYHINKLLIFIWLSCVSFKSITWSYNDSHGHSSQACTCKAVLISLLSQ